MVSTSLGMPARKPGFYSLLFLPLHFSRNVSLSRFPDTTRQADRQTSRRKHRRLSHFPARQESCTAAFRIPQGSAECRTANVEITDCAEYSESVSSHPPFCRRRTGKKLLLRNVGLSDSLCSLFPLLLFLSKPLLCVFHAFAFFFQINLIAHPTVLLYCPKLRQADRLPHFPQQEQFTAEIFSRYSCFVAELLKSEKEYNNSVV